MSFPYARTANRNSGLSGESLREWGSLNSGSSCCVLTAAHFLDMAISISRDMADISAAVI
jgi:hypothetical protein